ncbi:hypothetical protein C0J52_20141 [Blattella germanica]|nr:hypothetical protein C0J52_20141 [Blattella germanica]
MAQILGAFQERFNKTPPRKATLLEFSIGKDALLLLAVLKTGCGVEGRRHEKKHVLEFLLQENNLISSRHVNVLRNSVYRGQQCVIT